MEVFDKIKNIAKNSFGTDSEIEDAGLDIDAQSRVEIKDEKPAKKSNFQKNEKKLKIINFNDYKHLTESVKTKEINGKVSEVKEEIVFCKPESFSECTKIGDWIASNKIVILSIELLDNREAQRVIDFTTGVLYAKEGQLVDMSEKVFGYVPKKFLSVIDIPEGEGAGGIISMGFDFLVNEVEEIKPKYERQG